MKTRRLNKQGDKHVERQPDKTVLLPLNESRWQNYQTNIKDWYIQKKT